MKGARRGSGSRFRGRLRQRGAKERRLKGEQGDAIEAVDMGASKGCGARQSAPGPARGQGQSERGEREQGQLGVDKGARELDDAGDGGAVSGRGKGEGVHGAQRKGNMSGGCQLDSKRRQQGARVAGAGCGKRAAEAAARG